MGCLSLKPSKKKSNKPSKKQKASEEIKTIETCAEEVPEKQLQIIELCSSSHNSSLKEDFKIYSFDYLSSETILLEYNITKQSVDKISLGINLFPESGCLALTTGCIICAGGIDLTYHREVKNVFIINPFQKEIFEASEMLFVKRKLRLVQHLNFVYSIGGVKEKKIRNSNNYTSKQDYSNSFSRYCLDSDQ